MASKKRGRELARVEEDEDDELEAVTLAMGEGGVLATLRAVADGREVPPRQLVDLRAALKR